MRRLFSATLLLAVATPAAAQDVPLDPGDLLRPYYRALQEQVELPQATPGPVLAPDTLLTRIAFGSCNHQSRGQHMWDVIAATDPQLFMLIGDNVYGDNLWEGDAALTSLRDAYAEQAAHPEFQRFRRVVPMLTTWDDHDFGFNDGGALFAYKEWAETIYETFWHSPAEVRARPGIHHSRIVGPEGHRVQIILLDTRFFRDPFERREYTPDRPPLGPYVPDAAGELTMLGDAQWRWLEGELAKPADLRLVVSSIQILTDAHDYESWENLPREREQLYRLLEARAGGGLLLLSGDRHSGAIYTATPAAAGERLWEITSSSLNLAFSTTEQNTAREPDPRRVTDFIAEENFGLVEIDWAARTLDLSLRGNRGEVRAQRAVRWGE